VFNIINFEFSPTVHHSLISKQLGAGWKSLSEEERKPYYEEAQRLGYVFYV
jgi:hypothetical protein